ncbi:WD40-repeat-containing domain protein [Dipodascopsis tothii]|uniref:WD40-repeat-containing domain protein n=1 Tax=Dipodascopsis tothii TaxID=44089 RepID=UPI0034CE7E83
MSVAVHVPEASGASLGGSSPELRAKDAAELALEKAVFGDLDGFNWGLREAAGDSDDEEPAYATAEGQDEDLAGLQDSNLFMVDGEDETPMEAAVEPIVVDAAWDDSDDDRVVVSLASSDRLRKLRRSETDDSVTGREYSTRLRQQFQRIYSTPKWAAPRAQAEEPSSGEDEEEDEDDTRLSSDPLKTLLQNSARFTTKTKTRLLPASVLDISRLKDANAAAPSQAGVQALAFHPTNSILLSGGYDRTVRLYHIDGKTNPLATSVHFRSSPIQSAEFHPDGRRVFAGGRRRYFYIWDIETGAVDKIARMYGHERQQRSMERFKLSPCGRFMGLVGTGGWLNMLDARTGQWISGAKIEGGGVADFAWSSTGATVSIVNSAGEFWEWSTSERRFLSRWADYSSGTVTSLAATDRYYAIGSQSGIVNVYDRATSADADDSQPTQVAAFDQLVTPISRVDFAGPDGQMLCIASRSTKDALRLAHIQSATVFKNWPTSGTPLGRVTATAFSPGSQLFATGNEAGKVRLFKLNHYA